MCCLLTTLKCSLPLARLSTVTCLKNLVVILLFTMLLIPKVLEILQLLVEYISFSFLSGVGLELERVVSADLMMLVC